MNNREITETNDGRTKNLSTCHLGGGEAVEENASTKIEKVTVIQVKKLHPVDSKEEKTGGLFSEVYGTAQKNLFPRLFVVQSSRALRQS